MFSYKLSAAIQPALQLILKIKQLPKLFEKQIQRLDLVTFYIRLMQFTFEFDAPKYKCFGRQEPRRSTITEIDRKSVYDRWFLTMHDHSKDQQFQKVSILINADKQKSLQNKQQAKDPLKAETNLIKRQARMMKHSKPKNKNNQPMNKNIKSKSVTVKSQNSLQTQHINQIRLLAPKRGVQIKPQKIDQNKKVRPIKRNHPCLYPTRIQRQWQEQHGTSWYDLQGQSITQAQQSMRKRLQRQKTSKSLESGPTNMKNEGQKIVQKGKMMKKQAVLKTKKPTVLKNVIQSNGNKKDKIKNPLYKSPKRQAQLKGLSQSKNAK